MVLRWFRLVRRRVREALAGERGSDSGDAVRGARPVWREQGDEVERMEEMIAKQGVSSGFPSCFSPPLSCCVFLFFITVI